MAGDLLQIGTGWLAAQLQANASQPITYARGATQLELLAALGRKLFQLADTEGIRFEWTDKDFIVQAADLVIDGAPATPARGDLVTITIGDEICTYEVLAPGGETPWQYCDPYHQMIRIHGKLLSTSNVNYY